MLTCHWSRLEAWLTARPMRDQQLLCQYCALQRILERRGRGISVVASSMRTQTDVEFLANSLDFNRCPPAGNNLVSGDLLYIYEIWTDLILSEGLKNEKNSDLTKYRHGKTYQHAFHACADFNLHSFCINLSKSCLYILPRGVLFQHKL